MAAGRIVLPGWMPALDQNGTPIPNVVAYFYQNNTTILGVVYTDETLTTPLPNPVVANSAGQFPPIWADDTVLFSVTINAPFGPPGQPFTFDDLGASTSTNASALNKADRDLGNVEATSVATIQKLDIVNNSGVLAPGEVQAFSAGSNFAAVSVIGGGEVDDFVPDDTIFQDIPRSVTAITAVSDRADADVAIIGKGDAGIVRAGRMVVESATFGMRNNVTTLTVMSNPPGIEEINTNVDGLPLGDAQAAVYGAIPRQVVGTYPDIDQVGLFVRTYGNRPSPFAVTAYTATTVELAAPLPDDYLCPLTSFIQTAHTPPFRAEITGISEDRKTFTVYGWYRTANNTAGQLVIGTPNLIIDGVTSVAASSYTATTVVLPSAAPVGLTVNEYVTTAGIPSFRGHVSAISGDRLTITVRGWFQQFNTADGQVPNNTRGVYMNAYTKMFPTNVVNEILGPIYERVRDVVEGSTDPRLAWRTAAPGNVFIPYDPGEPNATKPAAAGPTAHLTELEPANLQQTAFSEWDSVNSRGLLNYNGTAINPSDGTPVYGESGIENFSGCIDFVNGNGAYPDPTTGQMVSGDSAFACRARGLFHRGYTSRDNRNAGFVVENGFINLANGFVFEAENGVPFLVETATRGITHRVTLDGTISSGAQKIGATATPFTHEVFTNGGAGANASTFRHVVSTGNGIDPYSATSTMIALTHIFQDQGLQPALTVSTVASITDDSYIDIRRGDGRGEIRALSSSTNADLSLTTQGPAGRIELQSNTAGYAVTSGFTTSKITHQWRIKINGNDYYIPLANASL